MKNLETNLIPVIIQHSENKDVLMLGYMNNEALKKTVKSKNVWFYSRSKKRLWEKGETSKNYLEVVSITTDCDKDVLLITVDPKGPTCHTGETMCFHDPNLKGLKFGKTFKISGKNIKWSGHFNAVCLSSCLLNRYFLYIFKIS